MAMISARPVVSLVMCLAPGSSKARLAGSVLQSLQPIPHGRVNAAWRVEVAWHLYAAQAPCRPASVTPCWW